MSVRATDAPDYARAMAEWGEHPATFMAGILGADLWGKQIEILDLVNEPRADVAIKGCHACSKTYTLAGAALHFICKHADGQVITTAPTWGQVKRVMWAEIRKAYRRSGIRFPVVNQVEIRTGRNENNNLIGISTNESTRFQGYHGQMLIILDEAPGIQPELHEAIEGIRASGDVRKVQLGNPTMSMGPFYDAFTTGAAHTTGITISALDTPNFAGVTLEQILTCDVADPWLDDNPWDFLITRRFVRSLADRVGIEHPMFISRVLGQFSQAGGSVIYPLAALEACRRGLLAGMAEPVRIGIDVAGAGRDKTVATAVRGIEIIEQRVFEGDNPVPEVNGWIAHYEATTGVEWVIVDETGIGFYFVRGIRKARRRVVGLNFGSSADPVGAAGERQPYADRKAQLYYDFRAKLVAGQVRGLERAPEAYKQMTIARAGQDAGTGQIRIEDKGAARRRMGGSPDHMESVILAYANPPVGEFRGQPAGLQPRPSVGAQRPDTVRRALFGVRG